ncbi:MAG: hypothetical protein N2202_01505 [Proteobacteria bacterium]|nr:hypothetical protein [Pseudomonadota bacterium]
MKKTVCLLLIGLVTFIMALNVSSVRAEEAKKIVGEVVKIELATDGKSAVVGIKDNKTQNVIEVYVYDDETLDKFKSYKIREGDEVRCRYEVKDGKNVSKSLLRTAGC